MRNKLVPIRTGVEGLDALLEKGGVVCHSDLGFFGVIVGSSGSGKSILGIQLCCSFLLQRLLDYKDKANVCRAVYISQEHTELVKAKIVETFDYFLPNFPSLANTFRGRSGGSSNGSTSQNLPFHITESLDDFETSGSRPSLRLLKLDLDTDKQKETLAEAFKVVSCYADKIRQGQSGPGAGPEARETMLVCVDNADIIDHQALAESLVAPEPSAGFIGLHHMPPPDTSPTGTTPPPSPGETVSNRGTYRKLRDSCSQSGVHTLFIFEEEVPPNWRSEVPEISASAEIYAADLAIRLGVRTYPIGYRERYLEIVKAKNQFYYRGMHHFSIVDRDQGDRAELKPEDRRVGLIVYPSLSTQLSRLRDEAKKPKPDSEASHAHLGLGIESLDKEVCAILHRSSTDRYIRRGSTSVLVSDLDVKASEIALHFAFHPLEGDPNAKMVYISLLHEKDDLSAMARRFGLLERVGGNRDDVSKERYVFQYYAPEHISEGKLMRDVGLLLNRTSDKESLIVVLDNVFELQCKYPMLSDARHFITALFELFRVKRATSLIVDTVEAGEARNPIEASFAAGLADNVFLLRHVEFQSKPHHVFSILKLVDGPTPESLWDLEERQVNEKTSEFVAGDTFDLYKNVLSGKPEPVNIAFTFYMDEKESPFYQYIVGQMRAIEQSFGKESITVNLYGPEEYSRVQNIVNLAAPPQRSGCHILALDEFWLEQLIDRELLEEIGPLIKEVESEKQLTPAQGEYQKSKYASAAHDLAIFRRCLKRRRSLQDYCDKWYAIPARNNCGMLCCDPHLVRKVLCARKHSAKGKPICHLDQWLNREKNELTWDDLLSLKESFGKYKQQKSKESRCPEVFFTFCMDQMESCVSFLIELALTHTREALVNQDNSTFLFKNIPPKCLTSMVALLDPGDLSSMAQSRFRSSTQEPAALFSRQWMSTLGCLRNRVLRKGSESPQDAYSSGEYFRRIEVFELPSSVCRGHPTPVSGTWYLGILKNSVALRTGVRILMQFTSVSDEIHKLNQYIGSPVRQAFYENTVKKAGAFCLPYSDQYIEISKKQEALLKYIKDGHQQSEPVDKEAQRGYEDLLYGDYPFYRMSIGDYHFVAPILWRLMVNTAKKAMASRRYRITEAQAVEIIGSADSEYQAIRKAAGH